LTKRGFDIWFAIAVLIPCMLLVGLALIALNPALNHGPLIYSARRMGQHGKPFRIYKFRTMRPAPDGTSRDPAAPLEADRITPLGAMLRRARIDELPQAINVLRGEMSLIGPRPDDLSHAEAYLRAVPDYGLRYGVRPGISGLAQVELGYLHGFDGARRKTVLDLHYINEAGLRLDRRIFWQTLRVMVDLKGA